MFSKGFKICLLKFSMWSAEMVEGSSERTGSGVSRDSIDSGIGGNLQGWIVVILLQ